MRTNRFSDDWFTIRGCYSSHELLEQARERGVVLKPRGERLGIDGPEAAVAALLPALTARKQALPALRRAE